MGHFLDLLHSSSVPFGEGLVFSISQPDESVGTAESKLVEALVILGVWVDSEESRLIISVLSSSALLTVVMPWVDLLLLQIGVDERWALNRQVILDGLWLDLLELVIFGGSNLPGLVFPVLTVDLTVEVTEAQSVETLLVLGEWEGSLDEVTVVVPFVVHSVTLSSGESPGLDNSDSKLLRVDVGWASNRFVVLEVFELIWLGVDTVNDFLVVNFFTSLNEVRSVVPLGLWVSLSVSSVFSISVDPGFRHLLVGNSVGLEVLGSDDGDPGLLVGVEDGGTELGDLSVEDQFSMGSILVTAIGDEELNDLIGGNSLGLLEESQQFVEQVASGEFTVSSHSVLNSDVLEHILGLNVGSHVQTDLFFESWDGSLGLQEVDSLLPAVFVSGDTSLTSSLDSVGQGTGNGDWVGSSEVETLDQLEVGSLSVDNTDGEKDTD